MCERPFLILVLGWNLVGLFLPAVAYTKPTAAQQMMQQGAKQVRLGKKLHRVSSQQIQLGNQLIQKSNRLQFLARQPKANPELKEIATDLAKKAENIRNEGAQFRTTANDLVAAGTHLLRLGFSDQQGINLDSVQQLKLESARVPETTAHNSPFRDLRSSKLDAAAAQNQIEKPKIGQTMQSQNIPKKLDTNPMILSANGEYFGYISTEEGIKLNRIHNWTLIVMTSLGEPATQLKVDVEGSMPGHVHGMPTRPQTLTEEKPGVYKIGGMKFQMPGWWVITFLINKDTPQEDRITFNILL